MKSLLMIALILVACSVAQAQSRADKQFKIAMGVYAGGVLADDPKFAGTI